MYTLNPAEASLNRAMIGRSAQVVMLADSSKFLSSAPYAVAPVTAAQTVITDNRLDASWKTRLAELNVAATIVPLGRNA